ncbi:MAG: DUF5658 family protein [Phycisphaerales bacterium JB059]
MRAPDLSDDREVTNAPGSRPVLYPNHYLWYVLAASLDLMLTNALINFHGFQEANALAARIIDLSGFGGLIAFKFATVVLVVLICEAVGSHRPGVGRRLAGAAVVISSLPVVLGLLQVVVF